jgi:hypothetical protein
MNYEILTAVLTVLAIITVLSVAASAGLGYLMYRIETNLRNQAKAQESDDG